jgi:hypothetical protein
MDSDYAWMMLGWLSEDFGVLGMIHLGLKNIVTYVSFSVMTLACLTSGEAQERVNEKQKESKAEGEWIQLFNGKDLSGWTPKIRGYKLGENFANTFRVEDGLLKVRYDGYDQYNERFGHLFHEGIYSNYRIRVEYRFVGNQVPGGPGWAIRNSGVMLHGQRPETMTLDQDFPCSIEAQLLGGDGVRDRTTLNLCTPGTHVEIGGKLFKPHCTSSKSQTYHGEQWVTAEIEVRGNEVIRHIMDGKVVLEYQHPQLDPGDANAKKIIKDDQVQLSEGTISLQSESHPIDFRKVEIQILK